ncbi:MAG: hypothetical protein A4S09_06835 [Proteobacteria bacterium SG_bin7]|nr:MAG: hypothetical protein A4S09_06835 [Proteobacteria bacterium SG_bin7]
MVWITKKSLLLSSIYLLSSSLGFAADIRRVTDYLVVYHETEEHFAKQNLSVKAGIYLYDPELAISRQDTQHLVSGGIWNSPFNKNEQIIAGYAPGIVKNTRNEIWVNFGNQSFLIQNQNKQNQRIAKGVPRVVVPVVNGAFLGAGENMSVVFVPHEVADGNVVRKAFDVPKMAFPVRYAVTRDGEKLIYLSNNNELVMVDKNGNHKILAKPPVDNNGAQIAFSGDGFFLQDGNNAMSYTPVAANGDVGAKEVIFDDKKADQSFLFRDNQAILKATKPAGGSIYYFINPEGNLSLVSSASNTGKVTAAEMNTLMSHGEDWGKRARMGNFDLEVSRPDYNDKIFMALRNQNNTWVNITGPYGVGQESLLRSFVRSFTDKRRASLGWSEYEVFSLPLSTFMRLQETAKASKEKDGGKDDPFAKIMMAITNKKVIVVMENFLDDPSLGPTNAPKAIDIFLSFFRESIMNGSVKIITTVTSDIWDKMAEKNLDRMGTVISMTPPPTEELRQLLAAKMKKLSDTYSVIFTSQVIDVIMNTAKELAPLEVEPLRSYKVAESLAKAFGVVGKKGQNRKQVLFQDAKRFLLSNVFDSSTIEDIDMKAFRAHFDKHIVGQADAKNKILGEFSSLSLGVVKMDRPLATMLFVGPTGVGKTESVKVISEYLKIPIVEVDMNFFASFDNTSTYYRNIKSFEGKPFILLMDEIDKSPEAKSTLSGLRGLIETGVYAKGTKNELNLRNAIIIMTGNYAQHVILEKPASVDHDQLVRDVREHVLNTKDTPENEQIPLHFWSRIENSVVVFRGLESRDLEMISFKFIAELRQAIVESHKIEVTVSQDYVKFTVDTSMEKKMGAVPVRDRIMKTLKREISAYISNIKTTDATRAAKIKKIFVTINAKGSLALIDNTDNRFPANLK